MKTNGVPVFERVLHGVGDLVAVHFAGRAAGHREILAGDVDRAAVDLAAAGDHAIGRQRLVGHAEQQGAVLRKEAHFLEGVAIEQVSEALARGQLAFAMLLGGALRSAAGAHALPRLLRAPRCCPSESCWPSSDKKVLNRYCKLRRGCVWGHARPPSLYDTPANAECATPCTRPPPLSTK